MATDPNNPNDYYSQIKYNYQPFDYANTPFGGPGSMGAGGSGVYPTTGQNAVNTAPAPNPTTPPSGGLFRPPDWLYDPQNAVIRAMRMQGMNPASFSPVNKQILANSGNFVSTLFGEMAGGPGGVNEDVVDQDKMLARLGQLIQQGAGGGRVFGGTSPQTLANFSQAAAANMAGTATPGQNLIADYLNSDPNRALNMATSLLYSGYAPQYQRAITAPLVNLSDYFQRLLEQGQTYDRSIIDVLLGAPVAGHPAGSPGVPLPFQASAWRYAPGGTPGLLPTGTDATTMGMGR